MSTDAQADKFPGDGSKPWWLRVGCFVFLLILASMATPQQSRAAVIGTFVGVFSGNDSTGALETIFGLSAGSLFEIGKVEDPATDDSAVGMDRAVLTAIPLVGGANSGAEWSFEIPVFDFW